MSEPAILVKRKGLASQVWSMEKLENKLIDMRDLYEEKEEKNVPLTVRVLCCMFQWEPYFLNYSVSYYEKPLII